MYRQIDGRWFYEREDRLLLHESAHSLVDLILTGEASSVDIDQRFTQGVCRKRWDPDLIAPWNADLMAAPCWRLHSYASGVAAEEVGFGGDDGHCAHDRAEGQKAERELQMVGARQISWGKALWVTKFWLTTCGRAWRAGAVKLSAGHYSATQMTATFLAADTGDLRSYSLRPFLSNPTWLASWQAIVRRLQAEGQG
jgi:hypothetical protein